jgi:hypothetical protein
VRFTGTEIQHVEHPKNLGVTLDRTLTYNAYLTKTSKKVSACINIVRKLAVRVGVQVQKRYTQLLWLLFTQRRNIVHQSG